MSEPLYTARAAISKVAGVHRRAHIAAGTLVDFGVHGPIRDFFKLHDAAELPLPVDYIVAATGA
ncbi:hypothetical protein BH23GEM9_BH23GEM9_03060 [soil metagenome]